MNIETDRLLIRSIQKTDLECLATLWTDSEVTFYIGGPRNHDEVFKSINEDLQADPQTTFNLWSVVEKGTNQIIGNCGKETIEFCCSRMLDFFRRYKIAETPSWNSVKLGWIRVHEVNFDETFYYCPYCGAKFETEVIE